MLTVTEPSVRLLEIYDIYLASVKKLFPYIEMVGKKKALIARKNLVAEATGYFIYIKKGDFKLKTGNKIVRLYSEGDFFFVSTLLSKFDFEIICEYKSELLLVKKDLLMANLVGEEEALNSWVLFQECLAVLNIALQEEYLSTGMRPELGMRTYAPGEVIIREGDRSDEIYEMMDGVAVVKHNEVEVGKIKEGEVFGEISFLINDLRTADIYAETPCTVNYIQRDDFLELIKHRPQLIYNIAENLAKRIVALNEKSV